MDDWIRKHKKDGTREPLLQQPSLPTNQQQSIKFLKKLPFNLFTHLTLIKIKTLVLRNSSLVKHF
jgi:hypothetical protein